MAPAGRGESWSAVLLLGPEAVVPTQMRDGGRILNREGLLLRGSRLPPKVCPRELCYHAGAPPHQEALRSCAPGAKLQPLPGGPTSSAISSCRDSPRARPLPRAGLVSSRLGAWACGTLYFGTVGACVLARSWLCHPPPSPSFSCCTRGARILSAERRSNSCPLRLGFSKHLPCKFKLTTSSFHLRRTTC